MRQIAPQVRATRQLVAMFSPQQVLADVAARRVLLDEVLGWGHVALTPDDSTEIWCGADAGGECDCGRDARVLQHLCQPFQEANR